MRIHPVVLLCAMTLTSALQAADAPPAAADQSDLIHDLDHPVMFEPRYADKAHWEQRRAALRQQVAVAAGLWPEPERTPLNPVVHGKIERDGYTIEKVFFASMPGHYVSGNLYRPTGKTGKLPAVLCPHGHWKNGREYEASDSEVKRQMEIGAEKIAEGARYPLQARCAMLARMGCIVFFYDMVGYADSQGIEHRAGFTDVEAILRLQSVMGLQTWNSIRALDFVCSLPDVDTSRLACTGASGGGTQTIILSVLDDRLAVSFPAVMVSEAMQGGCVCENAPLLRVGTNNAELIACFAPKPLGMTSADDWTVDLETKGFPAIHDIYKLYDAGDRVAAWHRSFPHNYNQVSRELMYNWMNTHLKLGQDAPVVEKPFVPVLPPQLGVFDADHPRPADSLDAKALRQQMTVESNNLMATVAERRSDWVRVVDTALGVMVHDRLPPNEELPVPRPPGIDLTSHEGTVPRTDGLAHVQYMATKPRDWNGTIVVWVSPFGKASVVNAKGDALPIAQKLLDAKSAIIVPEIYSGDSAMAAAAKQSYGGFFYGYNRSVIARRATDILTVIAMARGSNGVKSIDLVAFGKMGPAALIARALAHDAVDHASIDLDHFDFGDVKQANDERLLPGALKYGGIWGIAATCTTGQTVFWNSPPNSNALVKRTSNIVIKDEPGNEQAVIQGLGL